MKRTALEQALRLLRYRSRSRQELADKLREKYYEPDEITAAISQLSKIGLVNDSQLARNYARDKVEIYRRGKQRIFFELLKRGVSRETIDEALQTIEPADELAAAESLLKSKERQWRDFDDLTRKRRALALLQRRGFAPSVISQLLKRHHI